MATKNEPGRLVELTAVIWEESDGFVSVCPEIGVTSCGDSVEDAARMLEEAVALYVENSRELGLMNEGSAALIPGHRWTTSIRVAV
ncbi:MAG: type II toxin-antitoxin system HicB family antitoxin [Verrucomicrobia bacterium]|nr:MAG: type II toxin-antitoxin system HicB family antitoxin [Verrucomicrobiota bacterium]